MKDSTTVNRFDVDEAGLAALLEPRDDLLLELPTASAEDDPSVHRFELGSGPFDRYERTVTVSAPSDGRHAVVEEIRWRTAIPLWGRLFRPLVARQLRRTEPPPPRDPDDPPPTPP